jgi:hypothetical protein
MVSIHLHESVAAALNAQAESHGVSLEEFLTQVAKGPAKASSPLSDEEIERQFEALSFDGPVLPADFSRADIYLEHD